VPGNGAFSLLESTTIQDKLKTVFFLILEEPAILPGFFNLIDR